MELLYIWLPVLFFTLVCVIVGLKLRLNDYVPGQWLDDMEIECKAAIRKVLKEKEQSEWAYDQLVKTIEADRKEIEELELTKASLSKGLHSVMSDYEELYSAWTEDEDELVTLNEIETENLKYIEELENRDKRNALTIKMLKENCNEVCERYLDLVDLTNYNPEKENDHYLCGSCRYDDFSRDEFPCSVCHSMEAGPTNKWAPKDNYIKRG